jgi:hypothetical protein
LTKTSLNWPKIFAQARSRGSVLSNFTFLFTVVPNAARLACFRVINEVASDHLDTKATAGELQKFIAARK